MEKGDVPRICLKESPHTYGKIARTEGKRLCIQGLNPEQPGKKCPTYKLGKWLFSLNLLLLIVENAFGRGFEVPITHGSKFRASLLD